jgi:hypothetical protein
MIEVKFEKRSEKNLVEMTEDLMKETSSLIFSTAAECGINLFDVNLDGEKGILAKKYLELLKKSSDVLQEHARLLVGIELLNKKLDKLNEKFDDLNDKLEEDTKTEK